MFQQDDNKSLKDYRNLEAIFHRDLANCCRKYLNELGIISVIGVMDIVKQEVIELEKATKKTFDSEQNVAETGNIERF